MTNQDYRAVMSADVEYLTRRSMTKGYQLFSLLTPPLYTAFVLARRGKSPFSLNRLLRATWIGGVAGSVGGGAIEWARSSSTSAESVRSRRMYHAYNTSSIRADDHSTIGAILFAILTPAVFWNRARVVHLVLGGSGIGTGVGLLAHYGRTMSGDPPPRIEMPSPQIPS
ncbi:hypothetical protein PILCRDRAFT_815187 [Piloderma croceum F 1598]|uniref:Uncharacterized protein n=1 Tax=Piloderma croceum (strain F 1598) TaxID=765440 RepID=A0A0C3FTK6_PILCF|nr:hypothetical protein PILCRDRAFT_815187 [Piloderma croceum F 1598]